MLVSLFQVAHSCKKEGADAFNEIIDESILVESAKKEVRDPST